MNMNRYRFLQTLEAIGALLLACGLIALAAGVVGYSATRRMAGWPSAPGRVVLSETYTGEFRGRALRYAPAVRVAYEYTVDSQAFTGERVGQGPVPLEAASAESQRLLRDYPAGAAVTVYYDPADPASAVLERDPPAGTFAAAGWLFVLGLAVLGLRWLLRRWPREEEL